MDPLEEQQISNARRELDLILQLLPNTNTQNDLAVRVAAARSIMRTVDATTLMDRTDRIIDQSYLASGLQRIAYHDSDAGGVQDIAEWCVAQWLRILQHSDDSIEALQGLGQAWLSRAQATLARIHRQEGSSSSGSGNGGRPGTSGSVSYTTTDDAQDAARTAAEADARLHTADYVEARGILLPSTEYFTRAIDSAEKKGLLTGNLFASAAEAQMSLGNVSYSNVNEQYFRQALLYLRKASEMEGYRLSPYLRGYLDDYGRLIN